MTDETDVLAEKMFSATKEHLNQGTGEPVAIGDEKVVIILQALAKMSGYFLSRCSEETIERFFNLVRRNQSNAAREIAEHQRHIS